MSLPLAFKLALLRLPSHVVAVGRETGGEHVFTKSCFVSRKRVPDRGIDAVVVAYRDPKCSELLFLERHLRVGEDFTTVVHEMFAVVESRLEGGVPEYHTGHPKSEYLFLPDTHPTTSFYEDRPLSV